MDAMYEVWRAGGNTDRIDYDRVSDHHGNGDSYEAAARDELRRPERFRSPDGERLTLNTRQMPFEPLGASDLFIPNGHSTPKTL